MSDTNSTVEEILANVKKQQEAKAERMKDQFKGWTTPMLQARVAMLEGWREISAATWGEADYNPASYGPAPYINSEDEVYGLDNTWDIEREMQRRDREDK